MNTGLFRRILIVIALVSAITIVFGGATGRGPLLSSAAAFFALAISVVAVVANFEHWRRPAPRAGRAEAVRLFGALRRNSQLTVIAYAWGAAAMQGLYVTPLTGLWWQHGWQYALVMALLAGLTIVFLRTLRPPLPGADPSGWRLHFKLARPLAIAQGAVAVGGLTLMALSGKFATQKADWAANRVFAALAVCILAVTMATLVSIARSRARPAT